MLFLYQSILNPSNRLNNDTSAQWKKVSILDQYACAVLQINLLGITHTVTYTGVW